MTTQYHHWLTRLLCLALITALALGAAPAAARAQQPLPTSGDWLSFDGSAAPTSPTLSLLYANAYDISLRANLPGAQVEKVEADGQTYTRLGGDGYGHPAAVGLPDLPVLRQDVEIPFGAAVSLELVRAEYHEYTLAELGLTPIYPLQPPVVKLDGALENAPFVINRDFYASGARYPDAPVRLGEEYIVRGHRVQPVEVWPVAYDPAAGTVRLYSQVVFRLRLRGSDMALTRALADRYASPAFESRLAGQMLNYNQGRPAVQFSPDATMGYLIVTADAYYDAMLPFVALRQGSGFAVTMVRTSEIPGGATAANIQAYIQNAYHTWPTPPSYVLLVGDTNTIPTWTGLSATTSTDLYYATMDSSGTGDWHPDIGRGRFPVRSPEQTTIMVNKYLLYATLNGTEPWLRTASFPATCDRYTVAEGTHNYVINTHTAPGGWSGNFPTTNIPGGDKLYCVTYNATRTDLINMFNQGRWMIIYSGHGGYDGWEMSFSSSDVRNLTNDGMLPFVASHACISGDFGQTEVFGETWVLEPNQGALVYWGSSDSSYWDEDDVLERAMFDGFFEPPRGHSDVTDMTYEGLAAVEATYPSSARYYWETYNVLGDPAVKIFLEPETPTFTMEIEPDEHAVCAVGSAESTVTIESLRGYSQTVYLENGPLPTGVTAAFDPDAAQAPFSATLTLDVADAALAGEYGIVVTATDHVSVTRQAAVNLLVAEDAPESPALTSPADGATGQPFQPTLQWLPTALTRSYRVQVDTTPLFGAPLVDVGDIAGTSYTLGAPLAGGRCYWWRAQSDNVCGSGPWADPFHFATVNLALAFADDMESGAGNWSHAAAQGVDHWQLSTAQSHSPTHAWFVPDDAVVTDSRLWNTVAVPVGVGSTLTFWQRYQFEGTSYDGAVLEISTNGSTWSDLGPYITAGGYNGTVSTCCSNPLGGRQAWTGDLTTWTQVSVNLNSFAGQNVYIRWRLGCDSSISDVGWFIDDVQITAPLPPNPAPIVSGISPDSGAPDSETPVVISGSGFVETPSVRLGSTWLLSPTLVSSTTLNAVVPAGLAEGVYDLTLVNGDCQEAELLGAFTVVSGECISPTVTLLESDSPLQLGRPMHFTATVAGTQPFTYTWDFGGPGVGAGLDTPTPVFTYTAAGAYTVTLDVSNACGSDEASILVEALPTYPLYLPVILRNR